MQRFYIHPCEGPNRIEDPEGSELADFATAYSETLQAARDLWATAIIEGRDIAITHFEITDGSGQILGTVHSDAALPSSLRARLLQSG